MAESKKNISIIYYQKNDSPKYVEINKKRFIAFLVGLPTLTLLALTLGALGLIQTSPFHLLDNYRQNAKARIAIERHVELQNKLDDMTKTKEALESELQSLQKNIATSSPDTTSEAEGTDKDKTKTGATAINSPIGLSTLSFFKPIQGQKDKTHPASLNLTGFRVTSTNKDTINFQFNIINLLGGDVKLAGHIVVLMKNELAIQVYPQQALGLNDFQINFAAGEPFATQRFRPVDATFTRPKKSGNYMFTVYIFSRSGDLLHYQNVTLPLHI